MKRLIVAAAVATLGFAASTLAQDSTAVDSSQCRIVYSLALEFPTPEPGVHAVPEGSLTVRRLRQAYLDRPSDALNRTFGFRHVDLRGEAEPRFGRTRHCPAIHLLDGLPVDRCRPVKGRP